MKGQFTIKYLNFRKVWKIPCVVKTFPVFSLSAKIDDQIPCFLCAVATLNTEKWLSQKAATDPGFGQGGTPALIHLKNT